MRLFKETVSFEEKDTVLFYIQDRNKQWKDCKEKGLYRHIGEVKKEIQRR